MIIKIILNAALVDLNKLIDSNSFLNDNMEMINQIFKIISDEDYQTKEFSILKGTSQTNSETFYDDYIIDNDQEIIEYNSNKNVKANLNKANKSPKSSKNNQTSK